MTARAQAKGVLGVIIDGRCRDLAEHREAGFPVRFTYLASGRSETNLLISRSSHAVFLRLGNSLGSERAGSRFRSR